MNNKPIREQPVKPKALRPCCSCRWYVRVADLSRCHVNPPQIRLPYDNIAAWPVVPSSGGGCRLHEEVA